ncbi:TPA: glycosyltransferase [Candidatus Bathyarchaeota archaeon]|nr:glycosyltransferase [Candidatus Bathyarchaeota archaeon]
MITVIVPVKPPEPFLEILENEIHKELYDVPHEILIQTEEGLSYAVRKGIEKARGEIIVVMDADGSHSPKYLRPMVELVQNGYDLVLGSRYVEGGNSDLGFFRRLISRIYCKIASLMLHLDVKDPMSGFIVGKRELAEKLELADLSFKFGLELVCKANKVYEYPIFFEKRKKGRSKANFKQGIETLKLIWNLRKTLRNNHAG